MTTTNTLPALPDGSDARLPVAYEAARKSLQECERLDECKNWSDRAAALASYARQAKDESLFRTAQRIQARAVRRCGELLKQIPSASGTRTDLQPHDGAVTRLGAAQEAGLSERQKVTALRVASVPENDFDRRIEGPEPPTVTTLAQLGTVPRTRIVMDEPDANANPEVARALAGLLNFAEFCRGNNAEDTARGVPRGDLPAVQRCIGLIDRWLDRFITHLPEGRRPNSAGTVQEALRQSEGIK